MNRKMPEKSLRERFELFVAAQSADLAALNRRAMTRLLEIGLPTGRDESFTYVKNLRETDPEKFPFHFAERDQKTGNEAFEFSEGKRTIVEMINGNLISELESPGENEINCDMLGNDPERKKILSGLQRRVEEEKDPFALLNLAFFCDAVVLRVTADLPTETSLQLNIHSRGYEKDGTIFSRVLVIFEESSAAKITLLEVPAPQNTVSNVLIDVFVAQGAKAQITCLEAAEAGSRQTNKIVLRLAEKSRTRLLGAFEGGLFSRFAVEVHLDGPEVDFSLDGLAVLKNKLQFHCFIEVFHHAPHSRSRQLFRSTLLHHSRFSIDSTVFVDRGAEGTLSHQLFNNLMLSPTAKAAAKPNLQIKNDDVQCSHGATTGQLDKTQLFYLISRGLAPDKAEELLIRAHVESIVQKIPSRALRQTVDRRLLGRLQGVRP